MSDKVLQEHHHHSEGDSTVLESCKGSKDRRK